jgi:hypothetical protein
MVPGSCSSGDDVDICQNIDRQRYDNMFLEISWYEMISNA